MLDLISLLFLNLQIMKIKTKLLVSWIILIHISLFNCGLTYAQGTIHGTITSIHDSLPLQYVTVHAIGSVTITDEIDVYGNYSITADPDNYQINAILLGYDTVTIDTVLSLANNIELNIMMNRTAYPVPWVNAVLSEDGESCHVEWGLPIGPYELIGFSVGRVKHFDPCYGPEYGTLTPLANPGPTITEFTDIFAGGGAPGLFAYAVKPIYDFGSTNWTYSNTVLHGNNIVNFEISLCNGILPDSTLITMTYIDTCLYAEYYTWANDLGFASQDNVGSGLYNIQIEAPNQPVYNVDNVSIMNDTTIYIEFSSNMFPPRNLSMDSITNIATWETPLAADILFANFEETIFPPNWWWDISNCSIGWHRMDSDTNYSFYVPPGDGYFAVADNVESNSNGCDNNQDYLFTPLVSFVDGKNYYLQFDYYFDQKMDDQAYVVFKDTNQLQIDILESLGSSNGWETKLIDISGLASYGSGILNIGFHHTDNSWYIPTGLAIDNISIYTDESAIEGYEIYLDGIVIDTVPEDQTSYQFLDLINDQPYEVCVKAMYECGTSEKICESLNYYEQPIYSLPYFEGWDNKTSILNDWMVIGTDFNWRINNDIGSPAPSVHFRGDSVVGVEYSSSIISPLLIAENILSDSIFFEFDISQDVVYTTGTDTLRIAVSDGISWHYIYETRSTSDFDFSPHKFDISDIALGNIIQLKVETVGMNSSNISWYIDNINVYMVCNSPRLLRAEENWLEYSAPSVKLLWEAPTIAKNNVGRITQDNPELIDAQVDGIEVDIAVIESSLSNRGLLFGFNIYRRQNEESYMLYDMVDYLPGQNSYEFFDTIPHVDIHVEYFYQITAIWQSNLDYCESYPALSKLNPNEDFVYILLEDIVEQSSYNRLKVFPNPANDFVHIESNYPIKSVRIFNLSGQSIMVHNSTKNNRVSMNTENLDNGVYLVEIESDYSKYLEKLVIAR